MNSPDYNVTSTDETHLISIQGLASKWGFVHRRYDFLTAWIPSKQHSEH